MQLLTVSAGLYRIHHDILCCHERQLAAQSLLDYLGIYHQSVNHIQAEIQDTVDSQETFRNGKSLIGGIIQSSLKPLCCGGDCRIQCINHNIS